MSKINLTQHEQYLKSLESSLKKIGDHHQQISEAFQTARSHLTESWDMIVNLFGIIEHLRKTQIALEQEDQ